MNLDMNIVIYLLGLASTWGIVNRYIEFVKTAEEISVLRDGKAYSYEEVSHAE